MRLAQVLFAASMLFGLPLFLSPAFDVAYGDELHLRNKDVVRGKVVALQDSTITFASDNFGTLKVPRTKVERVVFQEANLLEEAACEDGECELLFDTEKAPRAPKEVTVQLLFRQPAEATIEPLDGPVKWRTPVVTPARQNAVAEGTRRFRISGVKDHPAKQFLATVEVGAVPPADLIHIEHYAIEVDLGAESFRQASQGEPAIEEFAVNRGSKAVVLFPAPPPLVKVTLTLEKAVEPTTAGFKFKDLLQLIK